MDYKEVVHVEKKGTPAVLTIDRPKSMNAVDFNVMDQIIAAMADFEQDKTIRCAIITGMGDKAFSAGGDIGVEAQAGTMGIYNMFRKAAALASAIEESRVPVIAAINGYCLGGGLELALACDYRIAAEHAKIGLPEVALAVLPGGGGTQRLPRLIGKSQALRLMYTGEKYSAQRSLELGMVDEVVPLENLMDAAFALADAIAKQPPLSISFIKTCVNQGMECDLQRGVQMESGLASLMFNTEDMKEAYAAFFEKRPPKPFKGR